MQVGTKRATAVWYDPFDPAIQEDPYPTYKLLRDQAPVYYNEERGFWAVSRFHDVHSAARDWSVLSSASGVELDESDQLFHTTGDFLASDPPRHDELREVVRRWYTPKAVRLLEPRIRKVADELVDRICATETADLVRDLARPLPNIVVFELMGFPKEDQQQLSEWLLTLTTERLPSERTIPSQAWKAAQSLREYIADAANQRRESVHEEEVLMDTIVRAELAGRISRTEMFGMVVVLLAAAIHTTSGLLSTALELLARHPDQRALLVREPARLPGAIEEFLRYDAPAQWLARTTTSEWELHGVVVPEGERLVLLYGSANRDERRFNEPDRLDVSRQPERHLSFGNGIHFCLGASIARLESKLALEAVLAKMPSYEIAGEVQRLYLPADRGLASLPVHSRRA